MAGLPREVLKWIQSLDLTWQIKTPKWDLTNGYLIAEIFSWYFPQEIQMHMYNNGTSLDSKQRNWSLLEIFIKRHKLEIPDKYVEGTIHCKEGAAQLLVNRIYEILTNRTINHNESDEGTDFTDHAYQEKLPLHARSTASQAVKNNLRITEIMADSNIILGQQKSQKILNDHVAHRRQEREQYPERFDKKPTLGELAVRRLPPQQTSKEATQLSEDLTTERATNKQEGCNSANISRGDRDDARENVPEQVHYKEIEVHQLGNNTQPIPGC